MPTEYLEPPDALLMPPQRGVNTANGSDSPSCVPNAESARRIVSAALKEDQGRSAQRAVIKGQYDGNPPYNQAKLQQQGMGWCANFNWLGMEGRIDGARVPYYQLFSGVPTYVTACAYGMDGNPDKPKWELAYAQKWTDVHNRWPQFNWHMQAQQFEMLFEGWGPIFREDDSNWRFKAIPARSLLFRKEAKSLVDEGLTWMAIRVPYTVHELFSKIRNENSARATGWNVQAVQDAIKWNTRAEGGSHPFREQQWEVWQERYKNRELEVSETSCDTIYCDHLFVQEYGGKVSHFIFVESANGAASTTKDFLFERKHRYQSFDNAVHVAFQNTGDGSWRSVRGMAYKAFKAEATMDRLNNRAVDNAFLSSGLTLQTADSRSQDRLQLRVTHGIAWIPPGVTNIDRNSSHGQIEGVLAVARYVDAQVSQKLGNFQQQSMGRQDGRGEMPTAAQVNQAAIKEASLSNGQIDNYYLNLDAIYKESDRRLKKSQDPEAVWFREQCREAGIPDEVMARMTVKANRISGYGSPQMRKMALQESFQLAPMLTPIGKNNWLNEAIGVIGGPDKIAVWNPPTEFPDGEDALISSENAQFRLQIEPPLVGNNVRHLVGHLGYAEVYLEPLAKATEEGQPLDQEALEDAMEYLTPMLEHTGAHLDLMRGDPTQAANVKLFDKQLRNLVGFNGKLYAEFRQIQQQAQQAAMEEQQANAIGMLDQAKLQSAEAEIERDNAKAEADISLKQTKARHAMELKTWQASQGTKLKAAQTASDIALKRIQTKSNGAKPKRS